MRTLIALTAALLASTALAADPPASSSFEVSLKAGGHFPQVVSPLSTSFDGVLHVGYAPWMEGRLQLFLEGGYSQPSHVTKGTDPRLGASGAAYSSTLTAMDLSTTLGASWFFAEPSAMWLPYAGLGLTAHFLKYDVTGSGGNAFGENTETATRFGGAVFGGAGYHLGPGLLLGELRFGYAPVTDKLTGSSNLGALSLLVGYGVLF